MMSLAIDNAATDNMMQLTGRNRFTRSLSGGYKMTNGSCVHSYSLRMEGEAIKESIVYESTAETRPESMSVSQMANGEDSIRSSAILMFI